MYYDITIQRDMTVANKRPDILLIEMATQKWTIIDIAVPSDFNVGRIEDWKVEKYQDLEFEVKKIHHVETAILPAVIGALRTVPRRLIGLIDFLGIGDHHSQHLHDSTIRNSINTMQGDESLSYTGWPTEFLKKFQNNSRTFSHISRTHGRQN